MAYALKKTTSLEALRSYVVQVLASLAASPDVADLAAPWRELREELRRAQEARDGDAEEEIRTSALVTVRDADLDAAIARLSRQALYLAGGRTKCEPYATLFGTRKATELQRLGPAKAAEAAAVLLSRIVVLGVPELDGVAGELAAARDALERAEREDAAAEVRLQTHGLKRLQLLQRVEELGGRTEAAILSRHPGRTDRIRALLSPTPRRRSAPRGPRAPEGEPA